MALGYRLRVDWDGDSTFSHSLADVTDDLVKSIVAKRGREYASQVYGRSVAGRLKATLRNDHERYSNLSQQSSLQGLVLPRRKVQLDTLYDVAETFAGIIVRATLTAGTELWPSGGTVAAGGDLQIDNTLAVGRLRWSGTTLTINRSTGSTNSLSDAFQTGTASGKSLYFVIGYSHIEIPSTAYLNGGTAFVRYNIPNTTPWDDVRSFLDGIGSGDEYEFIVADADASAITQEATPLWTGYIEQLEPIEQRSGADEIAIDAVGILSELTDRLVTSQMNENIRCDDAAEIILENAGIPDGDIGTLDAPRVIPRWWAGHQPAIEALRQIEETEGGVLFEDGDGRIRLDRAYARIVGSRRNEVAIFSDAHMQNSTGIATLKLREPAQDIANIVRVRVRRYSTGAEATLWELADPILLNSGASTTIVAEYESGVAAWTTPLVSTTDYTANAVEDGTGTDMTSDLGVSTEERGSELQITLTNNHSTDALYVLTLAPRGQPLTEGQPLIVLEKDQDSIDDYGERDYLVASSYLGTYSDALDYARYILSLLAQPQQRAKLSFFADSNETLARTLNVGDRVSLIARGVATSMFVESIEHRLERGGIHMLTLLLSPADVYASTIVLDVGPGLDTGILGR